MPLSEPIDTTGYRIIPKLAYHAPTPVAPPEPQIDPLLRLQKESESIPRARAFSTLLIDVAGQFDPNVTPPDTVGDVGPEYYIQAINAIGGSSIAVYDKDDGSLSAGPVALDSLTSLPNCQSGGGDPIVLYDGLANRWLLSEFAAIGNYLCVYISQTSDPLGFWWSYEFQTDEFPDYPKYAVGEDAYYVSTNESDGPSVYALERLKMLGGEGAMLQDFTASPLAGFSFNAFTPADPDGPNSPPSGAPGYFLRHRDDEAHNSPGNPAEDYLELWEFHVDWSTPANSTFSKAADIAVTEFDSDLCGLTSFVCFDQPDGTFQLDPLREVIMHRLQYRNFGSHETLVGNFAVDVDGSDHGGIRWFELRKTGPGAWGLYQEGTYGPDSADRWMGAISMDGCGNIALGYNIVDEGGIYPSLRYVGRLADDPLGTLHRGEFAIASGAADNSNNRYGDYSAMSVDPSDDRTFWFTGEYNPSTEPSFANWKTRIAAFRFDSCPSTTEEEFNILFMIPRGRRE